MLCPVADHSCGPATGRVNQARFAITFSSHKCLSQGHRLAGDSRPEVHGNLERRWVPVDTPAADMLEQLPATVQALQRGAVQFLITGSSTTTRAGT